jgi:hypothetical protein
MVVLRVVVVVAVVDVTVVVDKHLDARASDHWPSVWHTTSGVPWSTNPASHDLRVAQRDGGKGVVVEWGLGRVN